MDTHSEYLSSIKRNGYVVIQSLLPSDRLQGIKEELLNALRIWWNTPPSLNWWTHCYRRVTCYLLLRRYKFTLVKRLAEIFARSGMWLDTSGAVAIVDNATQRMMGTLQYYRSAPCIHGLEIGYVMHNLGDRRKGHATQALGLFSDLLFSVRPNFFRQQLIIEVWNTASWKVAENSGFVREGILRSCGFGEGDPADCFVYSRTQKDYTQAKASANGPGRKAI